MTYKKILIVDDSRLDRLLLLRAFQKEDGSSVAQMFEAHCAKDAVDMIAETEFDAIFLDINMPGDNGFHVLNAVRARETGTWPLVFMLSSSSHPDDIQMAYIGNATAYICKPDKAEKLRTVARHCIGLLEEICLPERLTPGFAAPLS